MSNYDIKITKTALKDINLLTPKLKRKLKNILIEIISDNPYLGKKLVGDLSPHYSYRLNIKDRILYLIDEKKKIVYIKRAKTHYGN
jgi:mRNA interferase RelE/StbE